MPSVIYNRRLFLGCFVLVEILGLLAVGLTSHWISAYRNGFPTTDLGIDFNWHPILMTVSLIYLYGHGALIYRLIPPRGDDHKQKLKIAHAVVMIVAFCVMVVGLKAAFDSHNYPDPPKPNMYTLHSWIGLTSAILFGIQFSLGFAAFLFPKFSPAVRAFLLPFHQYFGSAIFIMAVAAACLGHLEKQLWANKAGYPAKNPEGWLVNWTAMVLIFFAMGVTFLLSKFSTDRQLGVAPQ